MCDTTKSDAKKLSDLATLGEVIVIYGCEWDQMSQSLDLKFSINLNYLSFKFQTQI